MISQEDELDNIQDGSQAEPIDYKSEYEKAVAENATWKDKYSRRDSEYRSQQGQLAPTQKELARLKALVDSKKEETPNEWSAFEKDYPDEAKAHNARLTPLQKKLEELARKNDELERRYTERDREYTRKEKYNNVLASHPDFHEIMGSKEFNDFGFGLPKTLQDAFSNSENPDDEIHIHVLNLFKEKYANSKQTNAKKDYVTTQGIAPKTKQNQGSTFNEESSDPDELKYLKALSLAKKQRSN